MEIVVHKNLKIKHCEMLRKYLGLRDKAKRCNTHELKKSLSSKSNYHKTMYERTDLRGKDVLGVEEKLVKTITMALFGDTSKLLPPSTL